MDYRDETVRASLRVKAHLLDEAAMRRALMRISHEILEKNHGADNLCMVGVLRRGYVLAQMIRDNMKAIEGVEVPCGALDINFYRSDLSRVSDSPVVRKSELGFFVEGKDIILVDDVLFTGRTVHAAIEDIFSRGRPDSIQLAILIDRGHRELPIRADFVGKNIPTSKNEVIKVMLPPYDEETGVELCDRGE